jgi:hypothetical protein
MARSQVEYRDIPGHPGYRAGTDGTVWSCLTKQSLGRGCGTWQVIGRKWRKLKPLRTGAYLGVALRGKPAYVHRLILETFVGPCSEGLECCHNNGDCTNNKLTNLRWDTHRENSRDRIRHGTGTRGSRIPQAKLREEQIPLIRVLRTNGRTLREIAQVFGVSESAISQALRGSPSKVTAFCARQ